MLTIPFIISVNDFYLSVNFLINILGFHSFESLVWNNVGKLKFNIVFLYNNFNFMFKNFGKSKKIDCFELSD